MKVIYFAPRFPLPTIGGDRLLTERYLREFGRRWHLHFLGFAEGAAVDPEKIARLKRTGSLASVTVRPLGLSRVANAARGALLGWPLQAGYYHDSRMAIELRRLVADVRPDVVILQTVRLLPYMRALIGIPTVIHFVDALSMNYRRSRSVARNPLERLLYGYEAKTLEQMERSALRDADVACAVSPFDASYLNELRGPDDPVVRTSPLGVDDHYYSFRPMPVEPAFRIAMAGRMATRANADAAVWFAKEVLPELQRRLNRKVKFVLVGTEPARRVRQLRSNSVTVTGKVPDVRPFVWDSDLTVAPMRIATGVQTKILQSLSLGRPVVATSACVQGLGETPDGVYTADSTEEMVERIVGLYSDYGAVRASMPLAREAFVAKYAWEQVLGEFAGWVERAALGADRIPEAGSRHPAARSAE